MSDIPTERDRQREAIAGGVPGADGWTLEEIKKVESSLFVLGE